MDRRYVLATGAAAFAIFLASPVWSEDAADPLRAYNFVLLLDGEEAGRFVEASEIAADVDVTEFREAGAAIRKLPGQVRYRSLELRYGLSRSVDLWDWFSSTMTGEPEHRTVSVVMVDSDGETETFRWNLSDAWISGWRAGQLDASSGEIAIESMTIVFDRLERD